MNRREIRLIVAATLVIGGAALIAFIAINVNNHIRKENCATVSTSYC